jgi:hypothetical protein
MVLASRLNGNRRPGAPCGPEGGGSRISAAIYPLVKDLSSCLLIVVV